VRFLFPCCKICSPCVRSMLGCLCGSKVFSPAVHCVLMTPDKCPLSNSCKCGESAFLESVNSAPHGSELTSCGKTPNFQMLSVFLFLFSIEIT
jgi:hypothetical protein